MIHKLDFEDWLVAQKRKAKKDNQAFKKVFIGERSYPHIYGKVHYPRINHDVAQSAWLKEIVCNPDILAKHGFLPFISNDKRQRKFREPPYDYEFTNLRGGRNQQKFPHIKSRRIMYASHRDACIFSFYSYLLQQEYEKLLIDMNLVGSVIAYRSIDGKNNVDFAKEAFEEMQSRSEYDCIMLDVKGFFDNLDHSLLKKRWEILIPGGFTKNKDQGLIFNRITKYRYLNFNDAIRCLRLHRRRYLITEQSSLRLCSLRDYNKYLKRTVKANRTSKGIPQGSPISGTLANIYLMDFDSAMKSVIVEKHGGIYQRYSDDIFILCPPELAKTIYDELQQALAKEKLWLGVNKTEAFRMKSCNTYLENITTEVEPNGNNKRREAQYLGFHFNGKTISFRPSTLSRHVGFKRKANYLKGAYRKTLSKVVARQMNKIRSIVKKK